jgi:predicted RecA/RadA family phage recombinase
MSFIAQFIQAGKSVDYTPAVAVDAGDVVVQGELVGVATRDIAADALGALAVEGVFDVDKDTGSGTAITAGADIYWDSGNEVATTTVGSNKYMGKAVEAADDDDEKVRVRLDQ